MARPALGGGALAATIAGSVDLGEPTDGVGSPAPSGTVRLGVTTVEGQAPVVLEVDLGATGPELDRGRDGELVLRGSITRPAIELGQLGPPLLNPTIVLRWRAVLVPDD